MKSPCIDDPAYLALARHIARHPLDPYGFDQFWYDKPQPAIEVLAPPVFPYYLAAAIRWLGDDPILLKLSLFPWILLLVLSLRSLLRRLQRSPTLPVVGAVVGSPFVLPAINFMLDVPAWALSCTAVALFWRGLEARHLVSTLLSALTAGLATQTKYSALVLPGVLMGMAILQRQITRGMLVGGIAAAIFVAWECFTAQRYGESHFLLALHQSSSDMRERLATGVYFLRILGGVGMPIVFGVLAGLGSHRGILVSAGVAWLVTMFGLTLASDRTHSVWQPDTRSPGFGIHRAVLTVWGIIVVASLLAALVRVVRREKVRLIRSYSGQLCLWLLLETTAAWWMSPFPAARRVMGLTTLGMLLAARASRCTTSRGSWRVAGSLSLLIGLFFALTDLADSHLEPDAVRSAIDWIRSQPDSGEIWFVGHWGTQEAALKYGAKPLVPGQSRLRAGDWVLAAPDWVPQPRVRFDGPEWEMPVRVVVNRRWPFRTLPPSYGGDQVIEVWPNPMIELRVYRCREETIPHP